MVRTRTLERHVHCGARTADMLTSGSEGASRRKLGELRRLTLDWDEACALAHFEPWNGSQERLGIGVLGMFEHVADRCILDQIAGIHHANLVTVLCDDTEFMRDENHGHAGFSLEVGEKRHNPLLHRHIQGGSRFIGLELRQVAELSAFSGPAESIASTYPEAHTCDRITKPRQVLRS